MGFIPICDLPRSFFKIGLCHFCTITVLWRSIVCIRYFDMVLCITLKNKTTLPVCFKLNCKQNAAANIHTDEYKNGKAKVNSNAKTNT